MKKTIKLKQQLLQLQEDIIYQSLAELCESIELLFTPIKDEKYFLHTMTIYCSLMEQQIEMTFQFKPKKGNSYHVLFSDRLNFEHCVNPKKLNTIIYQTMENIYNTIINTSPVNISTLLSKKLYSQGYEEIKIDPENLVDKIKIIMDKNFQRYEMDKLNQQVLVVEKTKRLKV